LANSISRLRTSRQDGGEEEGAGLVAFLARRVECGAELLGETTVHFCCGGSCGAQRSSSAPALARLLVVAVLAKVGENARLFALLLEALQRALEILVS